MKRVLITGKNSYIGTRFETYMQAHQDECCVNRISVRSNEWTGMDFRNFDVVLHVAALVHKKEKKQSEPLYQAINCELAVEVAKKAKMSGVRQFIFLSTAAVFGSGVQRIDTDTKPDPTTFYGKSKLLAEQEILKLEDANFLVAIVRPPMIYGPECGGNFPRLVTLAGLLPIFPKINNRRSMLYIDNLCEFFRILIKKEVKGCFHPQDKEYVETSRMVGIIKGYMGKKMRFTTIFNFMIQPMSRVVGSVDKLFGDCYYEGEFSDSGDIARDSYVRTGLEEAVKKSLKGKINE